MMDGSDVCAPLNDMKSPPTFAPRLNARIRSIVNLRLRLVKDVVDMFKIRRNEAGYVLLGDMPMTILPDDLDLIESVGTQPVTSIHRLYINWGTLEASNFIALATRLTAREDTAEWTRAYKYLVLASDTTLFHIHNSMEDQTLRYHFSWDEDFTGAVDLLDKVSSITWKLGLH
jgi:hypothetical protein